MKIVQLKFLDISSKSVLTFHVQICKYFELDKYKNLPMKFYIQNIKMTESTVNVALKLYNWLPKLVVEIKKTSRIHLLEFRTNIFVAFNSFAALCKMVKHFGVVKNCFDEKKRTTYFICVFTRDSFK